MAANTGEYVNSEINQVIEEKVYQGEPLVFKGRKPDPGEMYKKLVKGILEALAVRFPTERSPVINATKISNLSNWPDPGSKDITDFGEEELDTIKKHFRDVLHNANVEVSELVGEWSLLKALVYKRRLAGKTIFITGASRGIGKAIALKAAKDGANIVIAAKTSRAHPKLPGTIYTAAKEVEAAGGKCLPCIVDVRSEDEVRKAVDEAVKKFGGIDILVNNASAISLTGTVETSMKKYDLMNQVNGRGTYLCSHVCVPYLKKSSNPHILNISPPLNMNVKWFQDHVAYTMAKYGMSMCVLGMAEEFKAEGIAVNALWPRTAIYTAAMEMLGGGDTIAKQCRKPEIMSDAAYVMFIKDSRSYTGHFAIDDEVLRDAGVTDLDQYAWSPGSKLLPDFFLDTEDPHLLRQQMAEEGATPAFGGSSSSSGGPAATFQTLKTILNEDLVKSTGGVFQFNLSGADKGEWYLDLKNGSGSCGEGAAPNGADCEMSLDSEDFAKMFKGELKAVSAFMGGKLKIKGDMGLAMKLEKLMNQMNSKL